MPNEETEELTETERALLAAYARWAGRASGTTSGSAAAKLLRIHDRLQAERRELVREYAQFAHDTYDQEGCGPAIANDEVRLMAWVMGGGEPDDPMRPGPPEERAGVTVFGEPTPPHMRRPR